MYFPLLIYNFQCSDDKEAGFYKGIVSPLEMFDVTALSKAEWSWMSQNTWKSTHQMAGQERCPCIAQRDEFKLNIRKLISNAGVFHLISSTKVRSFMIYCIMLLGNWGYYQVFLLHKKILLEYILLVCINRTRSCYNYRTSRIEWNEVNYSFKPLWIMLTLEGTIVSSKNLSVLFLFQEKTNRI